MKLTKQIIREIISEYKDNALENEDEFICNSSPTFEKIWKNDKSNTNIRELAGAFLKKYDEWGEKFEVRNGVRVNVLFCSLDGYCNVTFEQHMNVRLNFLNYLLDILDEE